MQHQQIDMQGTFLSERLATLPAWTDRDESRLVYIEADTSLWFGTDTAWTQITDHATLADLSLYARIAAVNNWTAHQLPNATITYNLGSDAKRWDYVYAVTFDGTATTATYADLAEKYTIDPDKNYDIGSIMEISTAESQFDIWLAQGNRDYIVGVVSEKPAYLMNAAAEGLAIGIAGRLPIRCVGPVTKRDFIVPYLDGSGIAGAKEDRIAIALETNLDPKEKMIECLLKV